MLSQLPAAGPELRTPPPSAEWALRSGPRGLWVGTESADRPWWVMGSGSDGACGWGHRDDRLPKRRRSPVGGVTGRWAGVEAGPVAAAPGERPHLLAPPRGLVGAPAGAELGWEEPVAAGPAGAPWLPEAPSPWGALGQTPGAARGCGPLARPDLCSREGSGAGAPCPPEVRGA